jgi:serine/threonine protein phosphatase PrpC
MESASLVKPYYTKEGYDRIVVNDEYRIYGVFDGMGIGEDSKFASSVTSKFFATKADDIVNYESLVKILQQANNLVNRRPGAGTTATIVFIDQINQLHYAHVGDSRLYVYNNFRIKQITADEGYSNILYNSIGHFDAKVCQLGIIPEWDKFILCTDGITGDTPEQWVSDTELESIIAIAQSTHNACISIMNLSKKNDDKSVIVVFKGKHDKTPQGN